MGIDVDALESTEVATRSVEELLHTAATSRQASFVRLELVDAEGVALTERSFHWLTTLGEAALPQAKLKIGTAALRGPTASVTVSSDRASVFTLLETAGGIEWAGKFSQNAFTLLPGESRTVTFTAKNLAQLNETQFGKQLKVCSLVDALVRPER